jgi:4-amino-4-deoxy-L-arabinose transferase-like glycosyltransferase
MFSMTLAALCVIRGARAGKTKWLVGSAVLTGVAFTAKMLVAFVPLPAFYAYFVLAARGNPRRVAGQAILMAAVAALVSVAWVATVAVTPVEDRPYVGSTPDNSIWTLVLGHNGFDRFGGICQISGLARVA